MKVGRLRLKTPSKSSLAPTSTKKFVFDRFPLLPITTSCAYPWKDSPRTLPSGTCPSLGITFGEVGSHVSVDFEPGNLQSKNGISSHLRHWTLQRPFFTGSYACHKLDVYSLHGEGICRMNSQRSVCALTAHSSPVECNCKVILL